MNESPWGWLPSPGEGIWRYGAVWMRPFCAAAPWVTFALVLATMAFVGSRFTAAPGVVFDLPTAGIVESEESRLIALAMPVVRESGGGEETLVVFDDARFTLSDHSSADSLRRALEEGVASDRGNVMLLLADRRIPAGDLMKLALIARSAGVRHVQIAARKEEASD